MFWWNRIKLLQEQNDTQKRIIDHLEDENRRFSQIIQHSCGDMDKITLILENEWLNIRIKS